jgi:hypothetical protein
MRRSAHILAGSGVAIAIQLSPTALSTENVDDLAACAAQRIRHARPLDCLNTASFMSNPIDSLVPQSDPGSITAPLRILSTVPVDNRLAGAVHGCAPCKLAIN